MVVEERILDFLVRFIFRPYSFVRYTPTAPADLLGTFCNLPDNLSSVPTCYRLKFTNIRRSFLSSRRSLSSIFMDLDWDFLSWIRNIITGAVIPSSNKLVELIFDNLMRCDVMMNKCYLSLLIFLVKLLIWILVNLVPAAAAKQEV